ncbi:MAG: hypothetical protein FWB86_09765 [Treponema sp.]|nr:hypothetical protein [Treponema sp.]MCL2252287.1 hypothetical protein [Treponema sp.]
MKINPLNILMIIILLGSCATSGTKVKPIDFSVDMDSPQINIGEVEIQMHLFMEMGDLKKQTADVIYFPDEDAVCVRFKKDYFTYSQFWNRTGRDIFLQALQKYNEDYDEKIINSRDRKSKQKYGVVRGYLNWQQFSYTMRARGNMDIELGYSFKNRTPYFTITQLEAEHIDVISKDNNKLSIAIPIYFTRAQSAELAAMFEQDFLDELVKEDS